MSKSPTTRMTLLLRIRDSQDQVAWNQFVELYAPLVHGYGMHHGLQNADAADLAQDVLQSVASAIKSFDYDADRGSFRGWLFTITRNKLRRTIKQRGRQVRATGESGVHELLGQHPSRDLDETLWNRSHQLRLFHWAAEQVRSGFKDATWQAFWQTTVENRPAVELSKQLGISVGAVYVAKSRVLARLREKIETVEPDFALSESIDEKNPNLP